MMPHEGSGPSGPGRDTDARFGGGQARPAAERSAHRDDGPFTSPTSIAAGSAALLIAWMAFLFQPALGLAIAVGLVAIGFGVARRWRRH